jgi:amidophosphoribosyltransferase
VEEIRGYLGVDSLGYLSIEGLLACEQEPANFCRACFTGHYPVPVDPSTRKLSIEHLHKQTQGAEW